MQKLMITGAGGFLGWNLCRLAKSRWKTCGLFHRNIFELQGVETRRVDLTRFPDVKQNLREVSPDAVIHAAARAGTNFCQLNPEESLLINVEATINLASLCADLRVPFVFISSDMVFNGLDPPYAEAAPVCPVSTYGEQKAEAERAVLDIYPDALVCRASLMYGDAGPGAASFIQSWIKDMRSGRELSLFADEIRTPVSAADAAKAILLFLPKTKGIVHIGGAERISRLDFGRILREVIGARDAPIVPCNLKDSKMPAPRPPDVSLDITRAKSLGFRPGPLRDELKKLACVRMD